MSYFADKFRSEFRNRASLARKMAELEARSTDVKRYKAYRELYEFGSREIQDTAWAHAYDTLVKK